ncbi:hypothetical protein T310_4547 [Rasamsonia emersonii CBS 393.64]|uniref:Uncharacterized protein n=1 Tax=Rasamsonia emersonii (strain ATCC 16479 / CBS 393.64 / IMI 116815) TaxID=1408163 RepID=A0A0F4YU92_RASE3|nr:hypothetical protein T310_4547 [Rasamsonia emersonii CBS 393.64]KKA21426.1 hypothetical protein T310_4547 [Rasamsonia emersonii CBS 393.64]
MALALRSLSRLTLIKEMASQASSASAFVDDIEREVTPRDLDAYIDALRRRVSESEGFAQQYWQLVLDHYLAVQASMPRIDEGEPKGLDKQVYQRIKTLKDIREQLSADDPQIANVIAILEAYRTKKLHIENGKVSCWSGGKQVTELEDLNWDTIASVASEHSAATQGDFWVEDLATTPNFLFWGKDFFLLCLFPVDVFGESSTLKIQWKTYLSQSPSLTEARTGSAIPRQGSSQTGQNPHQDSGRSCDITSIACV